MAHCIVVVQAARFLCIGCILCTIRRKQHRPGIASNDNTMHVPAARGSEDLTKPNHTPTRHTLAKDNVIPQISTPQAASSQRTHISRTQGCGRTHPVNRRVTTQYLHTRSVTTRRGCGRNGKHEDPSSQGHRHSCRSIGKQSVWGRRGGGQEAVEGKLYVVATLCNAHWTHPNAGPLMLVNSSLYFI